MIPAFEMSTRESIVTKKFIPSHGGYESLLSYQKTVIIYQGTLYFTLRVTARSTKWFKLPVPENKTSLKEVKARVLRKNLELNSRMLLERV